MGVFLLGGAIGGGIDAAIDLFAFAEPMVVAGLLGTGLLGLKKLLFDARQDEATESREDENGTASQEKESESSLSAELCALKKLGRDEEAKVLEVVIEKGQENDMDGDHIRALYERLIAKSKDKIQTGE